MPTMLRSVARASGGHTSLVLIALLALVLVTRGPAVTQAQDACDAPNVVITRGPEAHCFFSIAAAVAAANDGDTVQVSAGTFDEGVFDSSGWSSGIVVGDDITIQGAGSGQTTVQLEDGYTHRLFTIAQGATVTISNLTIQGGMGNLGRPGGGAIDVGSAADLTLLNVVITDNEAYSSGGAISNAGSLRIENSMITENSAGSGGGGGIQNSGTLEVVNSTISGNTVGSSNVGGGIYNSVSGLVTLTDSLVTGHLTGGGIYNEGTLTIEDGSAITANTGSGISNTGTLNVTGSTVADNTTSSHGGAIVNRNGTVTISDSVITGNTAAQGGAFFNHATGSGTASFTVEYSQLTGNNATSDGVKGHVVYNENSGVSAAADLARNWWGDPSGPGVNDAADVFATTTTSPWCLDEACTLFSDTRVRLSAGGTGTLNTTTGAASTVTVALVDGSGALLEVDGTFEVVFDGLEAAPNGDEATVGGEVIGPEGATVSLDFIDGLASVSVSTNRAGSGQLLTVTSVDGFEALTTGSPGQALTVNVTGTTWLDNLLPYSEVTVEPSAAFVGDLVTLTAVLKDQHGNVAPLSADATIYLDATAIGFDRFDNGVFTRQFTASAPGDYTVRVDVSTDGGGQYYSIGDTASVTFVSRPEELRIEPVGDVVVGEPFAVTIAALDANGTVITDIDGSSFAQDLSFIVNASGETIAPVPGTYTPVAGVFTVPGFTLYDTSDEVTIAASSVMFDHIRLDDRTSDVVTVHAGAVDYFTITQDGSDIATQDAAVEFLVDIAAFDRWGNLVATGPNAFDGTVTLSGGLCVPTGNLDVEAPTSGSFEAGVLSDVPLTVHQPCFSGSIIVNAGLPTESESNAFMVQNGPVVRLDVTAVEPVRAGEPFQVLVTGVDADDQPVLWGEHALTGLLDASIAILGSTAGTDGLGDVTLDFSGAPGWDWTAPPGPEFLPPGIALHTVTLVEAREDEQITVTLIDPAVSGSFEFDLLAAAANAAASSITAAPADTEIGESVLVTVTLRDGVGNQQSIGGESVAIYVDGELLTGVTDNDDGTYTAAFVPPASGPYVFTAHLGGDSSGPQIGGEGHNATVEVAPGELSNVSVNLSARAAGAGSSVTFTFTPEHTIPTGGYVEVQLPAGFTTSDATGDEVVDGWIRLLLTGGASGSTTATFDGVTNPTVAGNPGAFSIRTGVAGRVIDGPASVELESDRFIAAGPPSTTMSTVTVASDTVVANGVSNTGITVTMRDQYGNAISGQPVALDQDGSSSISDGGSTDGNGRVTFTIRSTTVGVVTYTARTATTTPVTLGEPVSVTFVAAAPDAMRSTVTVDHDTRRANGSDPATITVTVRDGSGEPIEGIEVTLDQGEANQGISDGGTGTTNEDGEVVFTVVSSGVLTITYEARAGGLLLGSVQVDFVAGPPVGIMVPGSTVLWTDAPSDPISIVLIDESGHETNAEVLTTFTLSSSSAGTVTFNPANPQIPAGQSSTTFTYADSAPSAATTITVTWQSGGVNLGSGMVIAEVLAAPTPPASPTPGAEEPPPAPPPAPRQVQAAGTASAGQPLTLEANDGGGFQVRVTAPAGALPPGATLSVEILEEIEAPGRRMPPPRLADLAALFRITATASDGSPLTGPFDPPLRLEVTGPVEMLPPGAAAGEIILAFWDGSRWTEIAASARVHSNGTFSLVASLDHLTVFSVQVHPHRGVFVPAPLARGLTITTWGGGGYAAMTSGLEAGNSVWVTVDGAFIGYVHGAPAFVNARFVEHFPGGVPVGTAVIVARR